MRTMIVAGIAFFLTLQALVASSEGKDELDYRELSKAFIRCAGTYTWASQVASIAEKPSAAEHMMGLARGAETAAAWALSITHNTDHPGDQRNLGDWDGFIEPQIEVGANRLRALSEMDDQDAISSEMQFCSDLNPIQADIVNHIREQVSIKRKPTR